jgi:hypothetical protein
MAVSCIAMLATLQGRLTQSGVGDGEFSPTAQRILYLIMAASVLFGTSKALEAATVPPDLQPYVSLFTGLVPVGLWGILATGLFFVFRGLAETAAAQPGYPTSAAYEPFQVRLTQENREPLPTTATAATAATATTTATEVGAIQRASEVGQTVPVLLQQIQGAIRRIEENGLVFSELAPTVKAEREYFQTRNRCIAALSDALLVIESAAKGGALVTANFANDFNKEVFALPGRANDAYSKGCNNLIRQQKAHLITSAEELCVLMDWKLEAKHTQLVIPELSSEETKIFNLLRREHALDLDVLKWKFEGENLALHILKLELKGVVRCLPGNKVELA